MVGLISDNNKANLEGIKNQSPPERQQEKGGARGLEYKAGAEELPPRYSGQTGQFLVPWCPPHTGIVMSHEHPGEALLPPSPAV